MKNRRAIISAGVSGVATLLISIGSFLALSNTPADISVDIEASGPPATEESVSVEEENPEDIDTQFESFEATAYCDFGITFSGVLVQRGIVAADPKILPIGSVIEVEAGDYSGIYTVMDTGGVVKGRIIDIYMPDYEEAIQFGRQEVNVRIIRRGWHPEAIPTFEYTVAG